MTHASVPDDQREIFLMNRLDKLKYREIAELLGISIKTVEAHRKKIKDKLNLPNTAALIKFALREGITSFDH